MKVQKTSDGHMLWCPGCDEAHHVPDDGRWDFNGDLESPTFSPSLHISHAARSGVNQPNVVCHSYVVNGYWQFLSDCTHALAGQTVPVPEWE